MMYPCIEIDLTKIAHNSKEIICACKTQGIDTFVVTKGYCADRKVVEAAMKGGGYGIADSRISNLKKLRDIECPKMLLRIPMLSEIVDLVKFVDITLVSEIETIKKIGQEAIRLGKKQQIIMMIDLGDLREGVWYQDAVDFVANILEVKGIELIGIGTNLTCYGGVIPDNVNLGVLGNLRYEIEERYDIKLKFVSGGNSSSLYKVLDQSIDKNINMLRIGESIILGRETAYGNRVNNTYDDAFILKGEIVEIRNKQSIPVGTIGMDAFGKVPVFQDRGIIKRAIIAIGRQDVKVDGLSSLDKDIDVIGASSDHMILDVTKSKKTYKLGDVIEFNMDYGAVLSAMTSEYVKKTYKVH